MKRQLSNIRKDGFVIFNIVWHTFLCCYVSYLISPLPSITSLEAVHHRSGEAYVTVVTLFNSRKGFGFQFNLEHLLAFAVHFIQIASG